MADLDKIKELAQEIADNPGTQGHVTLCVAGILEALQEPEAAPEGEPEEAPAGPASE